MHPKAFFPEYNCYSKLLYNLIDFHRSPSRIRTYSADIDFLSDLPSMRSFLATTRLVLRSDTFAIDLSTFPIDSDVDFGAARFPNVCICITAHFGMPTPTLNFIAIVTLKRNARFSWIH